MANNSGENSPTSNDDSKTHEAIAQEILAGLPNVNAEELPRMLIVANVHEDVFTKEHTREVFEGTFRNIDRNAEFQYLKSFKRIRIVFETSYEAIEAKYHYHEKELCGSRVKCFFAQPAIESRMSHLQLPALEKQFLISPPSSPPVGWEQVTENHPILDFDLIAAVSNLLPGASHELHPASDSLPAIVVDVSEDPEGYKERPAMRKTSRPEPNA